jgi:hypothetical protein
MRYRTLGFIVILFLIISMCPAFGQNVNDEIITSFSKLNEPKVIGLKPR